MYGNQRQGPLALAYIAGLIDGEGSFMITRSTNGKKRKFPSYTPRVKIAMTTIEPLKFVIQHTGYGKINKEVERRHRTNKKTLYQWQIHSLKNCLEFSELLRPYFILKIPQCEAMVKYCKLFVVKRKCMDGVDEDQRVFREEMYHLMRKLNGRHPAAETKPLSIREDETIVRA